MLDGGPSRVPQPIDRRRLRQPETLRQPDEGSVATDLEALTPNPNVSANKSSKRTGKLLIVGSILLTVAILGLLAWSLLKTDNIGIDSSKYQMVYFDNGTMYFGKLKVIDQANLRLTDIYYIRNDGESEEPSDNAQSPADGNMQLIKLGEEVYGPDDSMVINRDQVLFFQNLKADGRVSQLIKEHKSKND